MQPDLGRLSQSTQQQDKSETLFHRLLVGLDRTSQWPTWLIVLIVISLSALVTLIWYQVSGQQSWAITAGTVFLTFVLIDAADEEILVELICRACIDNIDIIHDLAA